MVKEVLCFPIRNTFTPEFDLSTQEALGICDWQAEDENGKVAFGHSEKEALENYEKL